MCVLGFEMRPLGKQSMLFSTEPSLQPLYEIFLKYPFYLSIICVCLCMHTCLCVCVCRICKYTLSYHKVLGNYRWISIFFSTLHISSVQVTTLFETIRVLLYFLMHLMCTFTKFTIHWLLQNQLLDFIWYFVSFGKD